MITITKLPPKIQIRKFANLIGKFPVTAGEVVEIAIEFGVYPNIINFYQDFPADTVFSDQDDLLTRSEQVLIMSAEEPKQPWEELRSPEE